VEHGLSKKKSKDKRINIKPRITPHAHTQTKSLCLQNIILFDAKDDSYFPYSGSTGISHLVLLIGSRKMEH
jgi:hypothetical protein